MAVERTLKSLANRFMDLDNLIEQQGEPAYTYAFVESRNICNKLVITWGKCAFSPYLHTWCQYGLKAHLPDVITSTYNLLEARGRITPITIFNKKVSVKLV
jgi:hypothetical protein